ncbi:MAG: Lrp/AsnC ligand binding domain-containing protein [Dehalococcoidia bacterium]|nr:MAG: Lrp/AsnC ligand binding domain-containing protein [Dehalococcoidia bacterium]
MKEVNLVLAKAFVLIETAVGKTTEVVSILNKIDSLTSVDIVTGPYDIIAVIEAEDLNRIGEVITGKIHAIKGIARTVTCLAV